LICGRGIRQHPPSPSGPSSPDDPKSRPPATAAAAGQAHPSRTSRLRAFSARLSNNVRARLADIARCVDVARDQIAPNFHRSGAQMTPNWTSTSRADVPASPNIVPESDRSSGRHFRSAKKRDKRITRSRPDRDRILSPLPERRERRHFGRDWPKSSKNT